MESFRNIYGFIPPVKTWINNITYLAKIWNDVNIWGNVLLKMVSAHGVRSTADAAINYYNKWNEIVFVNIDFLGSVCTNQ